MLNQIKFPRGSREAKNENNQIGVDFPMVKHGGTESQIWSFVILPYKYERDINKYGIKDHI